MNHLDFPFLFLLFANCNFWTLNHPLRGFNKDPFVFKLPCTALAFRTEVPIM